MLWVETHDYRPVMILSQLRCCIGFQFCRRRASSFRRWVFSLASKIEGERGDLERHLFIFGQCLERLGLEHLQLIVPWLDLDTSAERQGSNDVGRWLRCRRLLGGRCGVMIQLVTSLSPKCGLIKIGDILRAVVEDLYEVLRGARLILVRRILQKFDPLLVRRLFLFRCARKFKVVERLLVVEPQAIGETQIGCPCDVRARHDRVRARGWPRGWPRREARPPSRDSGRWYGPW